MLLSSSIIAALDAFGKLAGPAKISEEYLRDCLGKKFVLWRLIN